MVFFDDVEDPLHLREIRPKDFFFYRVLEDRGESSLKLMSRLILNPEVLDSVTSSQFRKLAIWIAENLFHDSIMTPENWLEVAFHLNKQRWDSAIDWLENQPMSKIKLMMEINRKVAEEQKNEINKGRRKKR